MNVFVVAVGCPLHEILITDTQHISLCAVILYRSHIIVLRFSSLFETSFHSCPHGESTIWSLYFVNLF